MGARGPAPKSADRRQRRNKAPGADLIVLERRHELPKLGRTALKATSVAWVEFWKSPLAQVVAEATDLPALRRLFSLYDERERSFRVYRKKRVVVGSQGQPTLNPLGKHVATLDGEIRALEDRFGLNPAARLRLGIDFGKAQRSLEQLNRDLDEDTDEEPEQDPRIIEAERL